MIFFPPYHCRHESCKQLANMLTSFTIYTALEHILNNKVIWKRTSKKNPLSDRHSLGWWGLQEDFGILLSWAVVISRPVDGGPDWLSHKQAHCLQRSQNHLSCGRSMPQASHPAMVHACLCHFLGAKYWEMQLCSLFVLEDFARRIRNKATAFCWLWFRLFSAHLYGGPLLTVCTAKQNAQS